MVEVLNLVEPIQANVSSLKDALQDIEDRDLLQRISDIDSTVDHERARSKHVPTTGEWLLQDEAFRRWSHGEERLLWLHGISGSGKTILSSTVVANLQKAYQDEEAVKIAFFYFEFTDSRKRTVEGCMRSILRQLSMPRPPEAVRALYHRTGSVCAQPALSAVRYALKGCLESLGRCILVLDALDECEDIGGLMETLIFLKSLPAVQLLLTSRPDPRIQRAVSALLGATIELKLSRVEQDVRIFVQQRLFANKELGGRWSDKRKKQIYRALVSKSAGMQVYG